MKQWILSALLFGASMTTALAQTATDSLRAQTGYRPLSTGDLYQGMSKTIPTGRVVLPYGLEVTFDKTSHLIFPSAIRYVDLGSNKLIAGKAEDAENVLRVKAAVRDFETETNMSVICEDGSFYAFNVKYAEEPEKLSVEMADFLSSTEGRLPSNRADIYFKELGSESPILVKLMMKTIHQNDERTVKHIGVRQFGIRSSCVGSMRTMACSTYIPVSTMRRTFLTRWTSSASRSSIRRWLDVRPSRSRSCSRYEPTTR